MIFVEPSPENYLKTLFLILAYGQKQIKDILRYISYEKYHENYIRYV